MDEFDLLEQFVGEDFVEKGLGKDYDEYLDGAIDALSEVCNDSPDFRYVTGYFLDENEFHGLHDTGKVWSTYNLDEIDQPVPENLTAAEYGDHKLQETCVDPKVRSSLKTKDFGCSKKLIQFVESFAKRKLGHRYDITVVPDSYLIYREGDHFETHIDSCRGETHIATAVYIVKEKNLRGGELEFSYRSCEGEGCLTLFYTTVPHRVTPVIRGEKHTITFEIHAKLVDHRALFLQSLNKYSHFVLHHAYTKSQLAAENLIGEDVDILNHVKSKGKYLLVTAEVSVMVTECHGVGGCIKYRDPEGVTARVSELAMEDDQLYFSCKKLYAPKDVIDVEGHDYGHDAPQVIPFEYHYGNQWEGPDSSYHRCAIICY